MAGGITLGMKALGIGGDDAAEQVARLLREGRAAEVTDEMLGALTPNDQAKLFDLYESGATGMDLPMDEASRMGRAEAGGFGKGTLFGDEMYHGTRREFPAFDPDASSATDHGWYGKGAAYLGNAELASEYAMGGMEKGNNVMPLHTRGRQFEWPEDQPMFLNAEDAAESSAAVRDLGYDGIDIRLPSSAGPEYAGNLHERLIFDPANIRSRHARFDPRLSKNADLLASRAAPGSGGIGTQEASSAPRGIMAIPMRPTSPTMPSGEGASLSDVLGRLKQAFGMAGKAGIEGMNTALSGVDEQGRSVGSILPFAKDERTGDVGLASPRILDLWNAAGGSVPARGVTLGAGPVLKRAYEAAPDSLMGFRRSGENVPFEGSKYKHVEDLTITLPDGSTFEDSIKGLNPAHAMERARRNWPDATSIERRRPAFRDIEDQA